MNEQALRRQFQSILDQYEPRRPGSPALLGDGMGNVEVSERPGYVYVRVGSEELVGQAYNNRVPNRENLPIIIGYSSEQPTLFQVLSIREVYAGADSGHSPIPQVVAHHKSHELGNADDGSDVVWVQKQQVLPLLAYPTSPSSLSINVAGDWYAWDDGWNYFSGGVADLSGYVPASMSDALYVLISIDGATNAIQYTAGSSLVPGAALADQIPSAPSGSVPVVAVYLTGGTTAIEWDNLYDVHLFNQPVGGSVTPAAHSLLDSTVHDDTVTDDPSQGSLIVGNSDPAWDELVVGSAHELLKINGAGTDPVWSAFDWDDIAAASGADMVHDHSAAGEGGQLDWDSVWSDAVHDHSSDAEGGATLGNHASGNITMSDDGWIGLGAAAGRISLMDEVTDIVVVDDAVLAIGDTPTPPLTYLLNLYGGGTTSQHFIAAWENGYGSQLMYYLGTDAGGDTYMYLGDTDGNMWVCLDIDYSYIAGPIEIGAHSGAQGICFVHQTDPSGALEALHINQADVSEQHIVCSADGADVDFPAIIELDVTGSPTFWWDESEDAFGLKNISGLLVEDEDWIGLGAAKARIEFNDEATDRIIIHDAYLGVGVTPASPLHVADTALNWGNDGSFVGAYVYFTKTAGASTEDDDIYGMIFNVEMDQSGGTIGHLTGVFGNAKLYDGAIGDGGSEDIRGGYFVSQVLGGVVAGEAIGAYGYVYQASGTVSDVIGSYARLNLDSGTISGDAYGLYVDVDDDLGVTGSVYMIYLYEGTGVDYGIYQSGAAGNYLGGDLEINGNLTSGGADPPYELYWGGENRETMLERVRRGVPPGRLNGIILFFNEDEKRMELFYPHTGEFFALQMTPAGKINPLDKTFEPEYFYIFDEWAGEVVCKERAPRNLNRRWQLCEGVELNPRTGKFRQREDRKIVSIEDAVRRL